jgi:DNA-binding protein HU-beta
MTKNELICKLMESQEKRGIPKTAASDVVESMFFNLTIALKRGRRFSYPGFGTFFVKKRKERKGRNPKTGETISIPASKTIFFRPAAKVKQFLK